MAKLLGMAAVHALDQAWISTGGTGAQNYDEFADDAEITGVIEANPDSALAVEMPHRAPGAPAVFADALDSAAQTLRRLQDSGRFAGEADVVIAYRITRPAGGGLDVPTHGIFAMVDTEQISSSPDEPGLVVRNEDVFIEKVRQRVALLERIEHQLSAVLLLQTTDGPGLQARIAEAIASAGEPSARDEAGDGSVHEVWAIPAADVPELLTAAGAGSLVVADGNHRSLAAQMAGLERFLAVVTSPEALEIQPYHRLVRDLPVPAGDVVPALEARGAVVRRIEGTSTPAEPGEVHLRLGADDLAVRLPVPDDADAVGRIDHTLVEEHLIRGVLGLDPGDHRITYVGGSYPDAWLAEQVDTGAAELAVLIAPVPVADFVTINLARQQMPRKSTWFVPKARAGLVAVPVTPRG